MYAIPWKSVHRRWLTGRHLLSSVSVNNFAERETTFSTVCESPDLRARFLVQTSTDGAENASMA